MLGGREAAICTFYPALLRDPKQMRPTPTLLLALCLLLSTKAAIGIMAGAPPDTPAARVDPNTTTSPWAGVGSLTIAGNTYNAAAIGTRYVLTAGHVAKGVDPAAITFNLNFGGNLTHQIAVTANFPHPGFVSFGSPNYQHDIAILELGADLPSGVPIYPLHYAAVAAGTDLTLVSYGNSGQGNVGPTVAGDPAVKRVGENNADSFEADVGGSGRNALFIYDFDGAGWNFMGNAGLGNTRETSVASHDSGSPSFVNVGGTWKIAGVNTFVTAFSGGPTTPSTFGTGGAGNLVWPYQSWIQSILSRPGNDTFANRFALNGPGGTTTGSNVGASKESGEPNHAGNAGGASVWWKWGGAASGVLTVDTIGSGFDTLLAVYTGSTVNGLTLIAMNDNAPGAGSASQVSFAVQAGTQYQIAVDGYNGASGSITLNWNFSPDASAAGADTPTLPEWGVIALAALLAFTLSHTAGRQR
jgi:hypothetical protein